MNDRKFWEARDDWYPTWKNGTTDDNALQVDYIRIYAATLTNERNEIYNVGGVGGRYLWQENCTFDDGDPVGKEKLLSDFNQCGDFCFENEMVGCNTFTIGNGTCFLKRISGLIPSRKSVNGSSICGYIPSRFSKTDFNYWTDIVMPCILAVFLACTVFLVYKYLTTVNQFAKTKSLLKGDPKKFDPTKPIEAQIQYLPYDEELEFPSSRLRMGILTS